MLVKGRVPACECDLGSSGHRVLLVLAVGDYAMMLLMLLRLAYLGITNAFALLRLRPGERDKDAEILALRHQLAVLHRQLGGQRVRFEPADRAWLAALLSTLSQPALHSLRLLMRPDTMLRWHRDLQARRHAAASHPRKDERKSLNSRYIYSFLKLVFKSE